MVQLTLAYSYLTGPAYYSVTSASAQDHFLKRASIDGLRCGGALSTQLCKKLLCRKVPSIRQGINIPMMQNLDGSPDVAVDIRPSSMAWKSSVSVGYENIMEAVEDAAARCKSQLSDSEPVDLALVFISSRYCERRGGSRPASAEEMAGLAISLPRLSSSHISFTRLGNKLHPPRILFSFHSAALPTLWADLRLVFFHSTFSPDL